ncbi:MAG TPA: ABC transporter ATP-binding protein [Treponemataceae bacterium]|nr:ABC transporter ATP-binding protein [Treponemataceae bacterium]
MEYAIEAKGLVKTYGRVRALDGVDLAVKRGEIFGLLGHNGAGKSTTVECVLGVKDRDAGTARVLGLDPVRDRRELFSRVGVQFQSTGYQDRIRVAEVCEATAVLYPRSRDWRELLDRFRLAGKARVEVKDLSGGERQKLSVLLALIPDPELVFLDELTTGLDPQARREVWSLIVALRDEGRTVVLTSHYMDEVERLCDRVAVMRRGRVVARGTPEELVAAGGGSNLEDAFIALMGDEEVAV